MCNFKFNYLTICNYLMAESMTGWEKMSNYFVVCRHFILLLQWSASSRINFCNSNLTEKSWKFGEINYISYVYISQSSPRKLFRPKFDKNLNFVYIAVYPLLGGRNKKTLSKIYFPPYSHPRITFWYFWWYLVVNFGMLLRISRILIFQIFNFLNFLMCNM